MTHLYRACPLILLLASVALAEDTALENGQQVSDYRWSLYTACSLVFATIVGYLIISHLSGAKLAEDIEHLERRVADLEGDA